jgi:MFS family permease
MEHQPVARRSRPLSRAAASALVTFAFVTTMVGATLPTPVYPLYQDRFRLDELTLTVVYAVYAAGVITALVFLGPLSDQVGRRRMLLLGLGLSAAGAVTFLVAADLPTLIVGRLLSGLAAGTVTGAATAALLDLAHPDRPGRASLIAAAANMGGLGLGPLLAGGLAEYAPHPLRLSFLVHLGLVAAALLGVRLLPATRPARGTVRPRLQPVRVPAGTRATFIRATAPGFAGFAVLGLFTAVSGNLLGAVAHGTNHLVTGLVAAVGFAAALVGQVISTGTTPHRALRSGCVVLLAASALVAAGLTTRSPALLVVAAVAAGAGLGLSFRAGLAVVTADCPAGQRAAVASAYFTTVYIALSVPVIGVGAGAQRVGWATAATAFAVVVGLLPLAALLALGRDGSAAPRIAPPGTSAGAVPATRGVVPTTARAAGRLPIPVIRAPVPPLAEPTG